MGHCANQGHFWLKYQKHVTNFLELLKSNVSFLLEKGHSLHITMNRGNKTASWNDKLNLEV